MTSAGVITKPVSITDVRNTLNHSNNSLGVLCTSPNINKWSLVKPVIDSSPVYYPVTKSGFGIISKTSNTAFYMRYIPPTSSYKRLLDFDGYNHNTEPPRLQPDYIRMHAETPDNISGVKEVFIDLYNAKKLMHMVSNEQSGVHNINQFIFKGDTEIITDLVYTGTDDILSNIGKVTVDKTLIKLRNPGITITRVYEGKFRSKYAGSGSVAGATFEFENKPLNLSLRFILQGRIIDSPYDLKKFEGGAVISPQSEFSFNMSEVGGTDVFPDSNIEMVWYAFGSSGIYMYIAFKSPLSSSLVTDLSQNLYLPHNTPTTYNIRLFRAYTQEDLVIKDPSPLQPANNTHAGCKCTVVYYNAYNTTTNINTTPALSTWLSGKPVMSVFCPIAINSNLPNVDKPVVLFKLYRP